METELLSLWKDIFGDHDGFWELFGETGFLPAHCRTVTLEGRLAAALYWFDVSCGGQSMAYLYAVATHPDFRGRGLCRRLMADTEAHLEALGYTGVLLVPEKPSLREMYARMGYEEGTTVSEFSCGMGESPVALGSVTPEEYARLRRKLLPPGGAVQEGENLTFLAAQARLYAGEDFLMAAWQNGGVLHAMELLGNADAAPGILKALGFPRGIFRTPGKELPFAMFKALREDAARPRYFGFAFD